MGSFSIWHWLIVLAVVVLVFGTKKLRNLGSDLGSAVKGFKDGLKEGSVQDNPEDKPTHTAEGQATQTANLAKPTQTQATIIDVDAHEKPTTSSK